MGLLTKCKPEECSDFFKNTIIHLSYMGLGSVESLLNLKLYELDVLKNCINDPDLDKEFAIIHGLPLED